MNSLHEFKVWVFLLTFIFLSNFTSSAYSLEVGVIFNQGSKFDKSYGESAYRGFEKFKKEYNKPYKSYDVSTEIEAEIALRRLSRSSDIIFAISYAYKFPLEKVAIENPDIKFVMVDEVVNLPNVKSLTFCEHEGAFLAGVLAASYTQTGKIGFIGGMDVPIIRKFELAYRLGAQHYNKFIRVYKSYTGSTDLAWRNPIKGAELAIGQINRGVDVIFSAAGGTGIGVYQAVADLDVYAIGVDSNQNHLQPGHMLTSITKSLGDKIYEILIDAKKGKFDAGITELGLEENAIDYALDQYNTKLLPKEVKKLLEETKTKIIKQEIKVPNYIKLPKEKRNKLFINKNLRNPGETQ